LLNFQSLTVVAIACTCNSALPLPPRSHGDGSWLGAKGLGVSSGGCSVFTESLSSRGREQNQGHCPRRRCLCPDRSMVEVPYRPSPCLYHVFLPPALCPMAVTDSDFSLILSSPQLWTAKSAAITGCWVVLSCISPLSCETCLMCTHDDRELCAS